MLRPADEIIFYASLLLVLCVVTYAVRRPTNEPKVLAPPKDSTRSGDAHMSAALLKEVERILQAGTQRGLAVCVYYRGRELACVVGGIGRTDGCSTWKPLEDDSLWMSYSVAKGVSAATLLSIADCGLCSYHDPVSKHWPAFGQSQKQHMTIAEAVSHRGGMVGLRLFGGGSALGQLWAYARGGGTRAWRDGLHFIETYAPEWLAGRYSSYHFVSFSWIIGGDCNETSWQCQNCLSVAAGWQGWSRR